LESLDTLWTDMEALAGSSATLDVFRAAVASPALAPFPTARPALLEVKEQLQAMLDVLKDAKAEADLCNSETLNLLRERYKDTLGELQLGESPRSFLKIDKLLDHLEYDKMYNHAALPAEARRILDKVVPLCEALCDAQNALDVAWRASPHAARRDEQGVAFLHKLRWDLRVASGVECGAEKPDPEKQDQMYANHGDGDQPCLRTRLYFTHNSHLQNLLIALSRPRAQKEGSNGGTATPVARAVAARLGFLAHFVIQLTRTRSTGKHRVTCYFRQSDATERTHLFDLPLEEVDDWFEELLAQVPDPSQAKDSSEG